MSKERIDRIAVIAVWCVGAALWILKGWWQVCAAVFALHAAETLIKGLRVGRKAGVPALKAAALTLIFGYTWWLPLEKRLKAAGE